MKLLTMRSVIFLVITIIILLFTISCGKIEKLPPEPSITFKSFEVFDSTDILGNKVKGGRLNYHFEDGDGDLGLAAPALNSTEDSTNLFFMLYRKINGVFLQVGDNDLLKPSPYRIPFMDRQGQNKILRGTIEVTFLYLFYTPTDTIRYRFFVKDRAQHSSDTVSTCEIALNRNGICNN
jgi:hypothetical protein